MVNIKNHANTFSAFRTTHRRKAISTSEIPEEIRVYLLDQILKHYKKNIFSGWDWQTYLLDIAVQLVKTEKEAGIILSLLHTHMHSEYESEQMTKLEYELIRKMKGETSRTG